MADVKVMMAGLPGSGKTTFLAAFWHRARSSDLSERSFVLRSEPDPRDYFYEIERTWLQLKRLDHSTFAEPKEARLPLLDQDGTEVDIDIPDIPGEGFRLLWETGAWPEATESIAEVATGILLFLRADKVRQPLLLEPDGAPKSEGDAKKNPWDRAIAPTQAKLCDLMETIEMRRGNIPSVAVVVSAWDTVLDKGLFPAKWLELNLPLLWQFFASRRDLLKHEVFGVSAQGGDVEDSATREALAAITPGDRVIVQQEEQRSHDIALPVEWLRKRG